jgi:hypothetical protein
VQKTRAGLPRSARVRLPERNVRPQQHGLGRCPPIPAIVRRVLPNTRCRAGHWHSTVPATAPRFFVRLRDRCDHVPVDRGGGSIFFADGVRMAGIAQHFDIGRTNRQGKRLDRRAPPAERAVDNGFGGRDQDRFRQGMRLGQQRPGPVARAQARANFGSACAHTVSTGRISRTATLSICLG